MLNRRLITARYFYNNAVALAMLLMWKVVQTLNRAFYHSRFEKWDHGFDDFQSILGLGFRLPYGWLTGNVGLFPSGSSMSFDRSPHIHTADVPCEVCFGSCYNWDMLGPRIPLKANITPMGLYPQYISYYSVVSMFFSIIPV